MRCNACSTCLPLNPEHLAAVPPELAMNTAVSFATNTNWQSYGGETTLGYLMQMLGLTVQNFVSAASGMAVLVALIRGFARRTAQTIGNFWYDLVRSTLYILLPLSLVGACFWCRRAWCRRSRSYEKVTPVQPAKGADGKPLVQTIAVGPAASQVIIKQLGTNGGGFFNVNSAHPLENPTPLTRFRRTAGDPADSRRPVLHVRPDDRRPAAGLGGAGRDVGDPRSTFAAAVCNDVVNRQFPTVSICL